jgi:hypothetical protein
MIKSGCEGRSDSPVDWINGEGGEGSDAMKVGVHAAMARMDNPRMHCIQNLPMGSTKPFIQNA